MAIVYRKDQEDIMKYRGGKMGVQAVPGAGKTFIITNLVTDLLKENPEGKILVLTYMNSAANNFKSRIRNLLGKGSPYINGFEVMTIHSFALKVIKENPNLAKVNEISEIIDDNQKNRLIDKTISDFNTNNPSSLSAFMDPNKVNAKSVSKWEGSFKSLVQSTIGSLKFNNIDEDYLEYRMTRNNMGTGFSEILKIISPIYSSYQKNLKKMGYMDYDDILVLAHNILINNPEVAKKYQKKYTYIFEDECQDSNAIQAKIINLISDVWKRGKKTGKKNIVKVGDINQSITGTFTGSSPKEFLAFLEEAKEEGQSFEMDMASRSSKTIIDYANHLVEKVNEDESEMYYKALEPLYIKEVPSGMPYKSNPSSSEKDVIINQIGLDKDEDIEYVSKRIKQIKKKHPEYSIGVLSYMNSEINYLADGFLSRGIEYEKLSSDNGEKKVIQDLQSIIMFLIKPAKRALFMDVVSECFLKRLDKELSDKEITALEVFLNGVDIKEFIYKDEDLGEVLSPIAKSLKRILSFNELDLSGLIADIASELNLSQEEKYLASCVGSYISSLENFEEDVDLFRIKDFLDIKRSKFFDSATEAIFQIGEKEPEPGSVTLATLHKSKGMEWDCVFIMNSSPFNAPTREDDPFMIDRYYLKKEEEYRYPEVNIRNDIARLVDPSSPLIGISDIKKELISEKARLLYVGITRAKRKLYLTNTKRTYLKKDKNYKWNKVYDDNRSEFLEILEEFKAEKYNKDKANNTGRGGLSDV